MRLADRVAVVTGAARGIGRAIALRLAAEGASVVVNDLHHMEQATETAAEITALGGGRRGLAIAADISDRAAMERLFDEAWAAFGRLDIAVANAAFTIRRPVLDYTVEEFQRVLDVVQMGTFNTCQLAARRMVNQGRGGKIVVISSIQAEKPFSNSAPYGMAKSAINHFVTAMAHELALQRINVNSINPGWIDTPGERAFATEEQIAENAKKLPWGRMGKPEEIAAAAAFLVSHEADYITGSVLRVDGGMMLG